MSGPRVTSGRGSSQDQATPEDFIGAVVRRYGSIEFDLAAHAGNTKHARYFAPTHFVQVGNREELEQVRIEICPEVWETVTVSLEAQVANWSAYFKAPVSVEPVKKKKKDGNQVFIRRVTNVDEKAYGLDAFAHSWAALTRKFSRPTGEGWSRSSSGLLWLNCEWNDVATWAQRCVDEAKDGANILLHVPAAVGTDWYPRYCASSSDTTICKGRVCYDGQDPYTKDVMICHFHPDAQGDFDIWDWRSGEVLHSWKMVAR